MHNFTGGLSNFQEKLEHGWVIRPHAVIEMSGWRHQMKAFSALLALCAGNSPVPGEFPAQRPVTRSFDVFFDLRRINGWVNKCKAGDLKRIRSYYDVTVMCIKNSMHASNLQWWWLLNICQQGWGCYSRNVFPQWPRPYWHHLIYWNRLTLIPARIRNYMASKIRDEIIYPFTNFNGAAVEVWEWRRNFIPYFIMDAGIKILEILWDIWNMTSQEFRTLMAFHIENIIL